MAAGRVTVRVLGGVEAELDGVPVPLPARLHRALLAVLALQAGRPVTVDAIVDALWGEAPPASALTTLQGYVAALRRALEPGRAARTPARVVVTRGAGYALDVPPADVDALALEAGARAGAEALAAGAPAIALARLEPALALWRGEPAPELAGSAAMAPVLARLAERRAGAAEDHAEALLAVGRAADAVAGLEQLVAADPLRERRQALLARALAATGRQADALAALRRARRLLAEELGLDPSSVLRDAETAVLRQAPAHVAAPPRPASAPSPSPSSAAASGEASAEVHARAAAALRSRLAALPRGGGGVAVVAGAAGAGKSVLVDRVAAEAVRHGVAVLRATCPDPGTAPGFWPLRRLLADLPGPAADAARAALTGTGSPSVDGASAQFLVYDAVATALQDAAVRGPVVLVLDDAHAADASTVAVLGLLAPDLARLPVLAVLALRDPVPAAALPLADLAARPGGTRVDLGPLPPAELAALGAAVLGRPPDDRLVGAVADRSGGTAFLAAELFRAGAGAPDPADAVRAALPGGVLARTAARVAALPEPARTLVRLAAFAGPDVDPALLGAASGLERLDVVDALDPAVAAGLLVDDGHVTRFAHALVRDAVAAGLGPGERARQHVRLADALSASGAPAAVVTHLLAAGPAVPAHQLVAATRAAAEASVRAGAWAEAAAVLARTVAALRERGDPAAWELLLDLGRVRRGVGDTVGAYAAFDEALASAQGDEARLRSAAAAYGAVALWSGRGITVHDPQLLTVLERAAEGAAVRGDARGEVAVRGALACELAYRDRAAAAAHADRGVALARTLGDPQLLVTALHHAWRANIVPWLAADQLARDDEALALLGAGPSGLTELVLRLQRASDLATLGRLGELDRELTTCRLLAAELRSPELSAQLGYVEVGLAMLRGQWDRVAALAGTAQDDLARTSRSDSSWSALAARWGMLHPSGRTGEVAGELCAAAADPHLASLRAAAAVAVLDGGDEARARELAGQWFAAPGEDWTWMIQVACWAELAARIGVPDPAAVRDLLAPCAGLLAVTGSILDCGGSVHALLAGLELRLGDPAAARDHALAAQRQETELGLRPWHARTAALVERTARQLLKGAGRSRPGSRRAP